MSRITLPPGHPLPPIAWRTVTLDGDGEQWRVPVNETWRWVEFEYERGRFRERIGGRAWSEWTRPMPVNEHDGFTLNGKPWPRPA